MICNQQPCVCLNTLVVLINIAYVLVSIKIIIFLLKFSEVVDPVNLVQTWEKDGRIRFRAEMYRRKLTDITGYIKENGPSQFLLTKMDPVKQPS